MLYFSLLRNFYIHPQAVRGWELFVLSSQLSLVLLCGEERGSKERRRKSCLSSTSAVSCGVQNWASFLQVWSSHLESAYVLSCFSPVQLFVTLWTVACQSVLSNPSSVHGILQARILEWVAMPSFRGSSQPRNETCVSYISLLCVCVCVGGSDGARNRHFNQNSTRIPMHTKHEKSLG